MQTIEIAVADDGLRREIEADVVGVWAIHPMILLDGTEGDTYTLTHVPSGLALDGTIGESQACLEQVRALLLEHVPGWASPDLPWGEGKNRIKDDDRSWELFAASVPHLIAGGVLVTQTTIDRINARTGASIAGSRRVIASTHET